MVANATDTYLRLQMGAVDGSLYNAFQLQQIADAVGSVLFNAEMIDMDYKFRGVTDANLLVFDAGLDALGAGGAAESGVKLKVTGDFKVTGNLKAAGVLLAYKSYAGGNASTTSATIVDADATNLAVTFTAPASGNVLVRLTAQSIPDTGANHQGAQHQWGLRESTTTIAGPHTVSRDTTGNGYAFAQAASVAFPITGLTPGNSYTYKWAHLVTASGTANIGASPPNGPAVMEVWALP